MTHIRSDPMLPEKPHRYVSTCGPRAVDAAQSDAIAAAENEGWPAVDRIRSSARITRTDAHRSREIAAIRMNRRT